MYSLFSSYASSLLVIIIIFSMFQAFTGVKERWAFLQSYVAKGQMISSAVAWGGFLWAHAICDFSFVTVIMHVSRPLSVFYRLGASWTSPEGSMLLWCVMLSVWNSCVASKKISRLSLSLMGLLTGSFWILLIGWFDPFVRLHHVASDGLGLNPLLHDVSLMIHPILLYAGYTSLSIPFCMALFTSEKREHARMLWWAKLSWTFLTAGLLTGSVWAYYELGWGGWWFWDPVENIALLPWLFLTALFHMKRHPFLSRYISLCITLAFSCVLWGTTCVRTGLFVSVHSFAPLPSRLIPLMSLASLWSVLGIMRAIWTMRKACRPAPIFLPSFFSSIIPVGFLITVAVIVGIGTFLPLAIPHTLHVDEHFYNHVLFFVMLGPCVALPLFSSPMSTRAFWGIITLTLGILWCLLVMVTFPSLKALICVGLACWVGIGSIPLLKERRRIPQGLAHLAVAFCLAGVSMGSYWKTEKETPLCVGAKTTVGEYDVLLKEVTLTRSSLFDTERAHLVFKKGSTELSLFPERRLYHAQNLLTIETALFSRWDQDIYTVLGDYVAKNTWLIRVTLYPGIWVLWGGGILFMIAGLLSLSQRSYNLLRGCYEKQTVQEKETDKERVQTDV